MQPKEIKSLDEFVVNKINELEKELFMTRQELFLTRKQLEEITAKESEKIWYKYKEEENNDISNSEPDRG